MMMSSKIGYFYARREDDGGDDDGDEIMVWNAPTLQLSNKYSVTATLSSRSCWW
jgi:hypothetical protein